MSRRRIPVPHTLVLLFGMIVLAWVLTHLIPAGQFERETHDGHEYVVADTYERLDVSPSLPPQAIFTAIPQGFEEAAGIIFFVFLIGGTFAVFRATGAADAMIGVTLDRMKSYPALLVASGMLIFAVGSSTIGMAEEYLPFVPILVALCLSFGFDTVTAVGIMCVGYGIGYGAAAINPFTVLIAQDIAGITPTSGWLVRIGLLVVFLAIGFHHVWRYAKRVQNDPSRSLVAGIEPDPAMVVSTRVELTATHVAVLLVLFSALIWLIWGLTQWGWYLVEMSALAVGVAALLGLVARLGFDRTAIEFCRGAAELTTTALLIGFARTIQVVLDGGLVIDTIIHGIAQPLQRLGPEAASVGMLAVQSLCNFFIPSGSGQAYVTMPIMAPLADLVGVTRQVAVLAYQLGDGLTNILVPTNAVLIGILTMARIPYDRWLRFILPFMLKIWVAAAAALIVATLAGWS